MSFKDLKTKASELFEVGPSILIQRFDKDFEEFVDVEQYSRTNKLNPHMTSGPGIEPPPHWWKMSALTTAPLVESSALTTAPLIELKLSSIICVFS